MSRERKYYPNKKPGTCEHCDQSVPAGGGRVRRTRDRRWIASHHPARQVGWPVPRYEGGCPPKTGESS